MCTAITFRSKDCYFGRNLDLEHSYGECVIVTPRDFPLPFRMLPPRAAHHAMIGIGLVRGNYPLYFDAVNEKGLAMAGLNFPGNARYHSPHPDKDNVASFELIPWVLSQCSTLSQARELLQRLNLTDTDFSPSFPHTPLHWIIADRHTCFVAEPTADGLRLYDNPAGVLTNEPPFPAQLHRLSDYLHLSATPPVNRFAPHLPLTPYSRGMGGLGLPGDWSSPSRFVRTAFAVHNSPSPIDATHFFHLMSCVEVPRGSVRLENGHEVISIYTSCCDLERGIYHYVTYENRQICAIDLHRSDLDGDSLHSYALITRQQIKMQNEKAGT